MISDVGGSGGLLQQENSRPVEGVYCILDLYHYTAM